VQDTEFSVIVKLFRVIEMCLKKSCGELVQVYSCLMYLLFIIICNRKFFFFKCDNGCRLSRFLPIEPMAI